MNGSANTSSGFDQMNSTNQTSMIDDSGSAGLFLVVSVYVQLIFGIIGIIFNSLTFAVIIPHVKEKSIYLLFLLLSIVDFIYLVLSVTFWMVYVTSGGTINIIQLSGCHVLPLISLISGELSSWILVAITVERLVYAYNVKSVINYLSHKYIVVYLITIIGIFLAVNFPYVGGVVPADGISYRPCKGRTDTIEEYFFNIHEIFEYTVYICIPSVLLIVLNSILVHKVLKMHKTIYPSSNNTNQNVKSSKNGNAQNQEVNKNAGKSTSASAFNSKPGCSNNDPVPSTSQQNPPSKVSQEKQAIKLAKTCFLLSFSFVLLTLPFYVVTVVKYIIVDITTPFSVQYLVEALQTVTYIMTLLNHSINCVLYCLSGRKFKKQLFDLLKCRRYH